MQNKILNHYLSQDLTTQPNFFDIQSQCNKINSNSLNTQSQGFVYKTESFDNRSLENKTENVRMDSTSTTVNAKISSIDCKSNNVEPKIKHLDDQSLELKTKNLVSQERDITVQILHCLHEINRRRYFAKRGYPSLFEYAVKELKYSESQAHRRISAMRLIQELPEVEQKLADGYLTLATVAQAQTFFRQETKTTGVARNSEQKRELLTKLEGQSKRTVEKTLIELCPKIIQTKETLKPIADKLYELKIVLTESQQQKLERLKELKSQNSTAEILDWMMDLALNKIDPLNKKPSRIRNKNLNVQSEPKHKINSAAGSKEIARSESISNSNLTKADLVNQRVSDSAGVDLQSDSYSRRAVSVPGKVKRVIPSGFKKQLWARSGGQCEFVEPVTGRRCDCRRLLEIDHIKPLGIGGTSDFKNLRLVCRTHNQLFAMQVFGQKHMAQFLPGIK